MTALMDFAEGIGLRPLLLERCSDDELDRLADCKVVWNYRYRTRLGSARWSDKHSRSQIDLNAKMSDPDEIAETLLHEIAHVLSPIGSAHGPEWQAIARRLGCSDRATATEVHMPVQRNRKSPIRPVAQCVQCNFVVRRRRALPRNRRFVHIGCGGEMQRIP